MPLSRFYDVRRDEHGDRFIEPFVDGFQLLRLPLLNKGTAFTEDERARLGLEGLLPPQFDGLEGQLTRLDARYRLIAEPLERHVFLRLLQDRNEVLFYAFVARHLEAVLPIIYTPTVGQAVQEFSAIYRVPRGFTLTAASAPQAETALANVPLDDVRLIVATDASAILGIGDQGWGGMAISIGKLAIYTVAGGIGPDKTLPVALDVGTDRASLRDDPHYLGVRAPRLRGEAYFEVVDRFVEAVRARYPKAVLQWEDLSKDTAFDVLERYRDVLPSFNDDVQGTGAVMLAGLLSACRLKGERLADQRVVISGAGAGGIGVAWAIVEGLVREGLAPGDAHARVAVLDSRGVLHDGRELDAYKRPFAQRAEAVASWAAEGATPDLLETVRGLRATALIGLSGQGGQFGEDVVRAVQAHTERPIVFPVSNPTANTEALPIDVLRWTEGRALVATGSPFDPVELDGTSYPIGQGNNAFVFPGLGFGAVLARARRVTDAMVLAGAYALAAYTAARHPDRVYPPVAELRAVSVEVAAAVMGAAVADGVADEPAIAGLDADARIAYVQARFWEPRYLPYRTAGSDVDRGDG
jgi:malate dehydrogenase (oxaloacetate-decarboxylating)